MRNVVVTCALIWVMGAARASAQETITVAWDPSPEADVSGYTLLSGTSPGVYRWAQWVGNTTERTMTIPPGTYYFAVRAQNIYGMQSAVSAEISATIAALPPPTPNWQAVWQNVNSGQIVHWDMHRSVYVTGGALGLGGTETAWRVKTSADFNGDGHRDLIFQHEQGYIAVWLLNGNGFVESQVIDRMSDTNWNIVGAADFNADGHTDIVFQHRRTGDLALWQMNGLRRAHGLSLGRVPDVNWRIAGVGDLNGDSLPDLLWQHLETGTITSWLMNGTTMVGAGTFSRSSSGDPLWRLKGMADVNDDGHTDLLWQHETSNQLAAWYLNGRTIVGETLLTPAQVPAGWVMIGPR